MSLRGGQAAPEITKISDYQRLQFLQLANFQGWPDFLGSIILIFLTLFLDDFYFYDLYSKKT